MRAASKGQPVPLQRLQLGTRFFLRDRAGVLDRLGPGSATVTLERHVSRSFTPTIGRNAGKEVYITCERETTQWSLETMVNPEVRG